MFKNEMGIKLLKLLADLFYSNYLFILCVIYIFFLLNLTQLPHVLV